METTLAATAESLGKYADSARKAYDSAAVKLAYAAHGWHKASVRYPDIYRGNPFLELGSLAEAALAFEAANLEWSGAVSDYCKAVDAEIAEWEATH